MLYTETVPVIDGCRIFERSRAYIVPSGVEASLQFTFRAPGGAPVRLDETDQVFALIREPLSHGSRTHDATSIHDPIYRIEATPIIEGTSPNEYVEKADAELPEDLIDRPGVYEIEWAAFAVGAERPYRTARSLLSIERSNWTRLGSELANRRGPPTIDEVRYALQDNGRIDNVLLQRSEFSADQILYAYVRPILMWNEARPQMIGHSHTTRTFPYREQWLVATCALLQQAAATNYMRNKTSNEKDLLKDRDRDYAALAARDLDEYKKFITGMKTAISANQCWGEFRSDYSALNGMY